MLEEVSEPGAARLLVFGADVIPDRQRHDRHRMIFGENHREPVRKGVALMGNLRNLELGGLRRGLRVHR